MVCGDAAKPRFRTWDRPDRHLGVPRGRPDGCKQARDRPLAFGLAASTGYHGDLRFGNWEMSDDLS